MFDKLQKKFVNYKELLLYAFLNILLFYIIPYFVLPKDTTYYNCTLPIDDYIPFIAIFAFPYVFAFVQWAYFYYKCTITAAYKKYLQAVIISVLISGFFFIFFPTIMQQPEPVGFGSWLVKIIYACDSPTRLFPSLHCAFSFLATACEFQTCSTKAGKYFSLGLTIVICASTVLIKQHCFVDIPAGLFTGYLSLKIVNLMEARKNLNTTK